MDFANGRLGRVVDWCIRHARQVALAGALLGVVALVLTVTRFAITSDTGSLISPKLDWRQREAAFDRAFPTLGDLIVVVVDAKTPELANAGADKLAAALKADSTLFPRVEQPDGGPWLEREGLLLQSTAEVQAAMAQLERAEPFLGPVAADPSLRGLMSSLSTLSEGVQHGAAKPADIAPLARPLADSLQRVADGKPEFFSWSGALSGSRPGTRELRKLVVVQPRLDHDALEPGGEASDAIRARIRTLGLDAAHGYEVRLTGDVPLADEEFASLTDGAWLVGGLMLTAIVAMLFLAVRSWKLVGYILGVTFTGLFVTCAAGLLIYGRFNLISVAFIPLFVGLGVDFGIQFAVRYRAGQHSHSDTDTAIVAAGRDVGGSLTLAAAGIALGFMAFLPTDYVGVSQLGAIAGLGMLVALGLNLTLLPALIRLSPPAPGHAEADLKFLCRAEGWLTNHRRTILIASGAAAALGLLLGPMLRFDFNPLHLKNPNAESVLALDDLMKDPDRSPNTLNVLAPSLAAADAKAKALETLPEVQSAMTLSVLIPTDQAPKLKAIADAQLLLDAAVNPFLTPPPPSDAETKAALAKTAQDLRAAAAIDPKAPGAADLDRLAGVLAKLAAGPPALRTRAADAVIPGMTALIDEIRQMLQAQPVTLATLPPDLVSDWIAKDGRAVVRVSPKGNAGDNAVLERFTKAVQKAAPDAVGAPISIQKAGQTITDAFLSAGVYAFLAITLLLVVVLRSPREVAYTLAPIILTGLLTLATCVLIGQPINDANIIAFPLLFGIGVAFQIYFVMAWRRGDERLLSSSLARAVFFSALTTATGFGSLWISHHAGTASMGKLLMISLFWTLVSALVFQPALMGPARRRGAVVNAKAYPPGRSASRSEPSARRTRASQRNPTG